jgi:L-lactate dehydrogenase complex protein LldG
MTAIETSAAIERFVARAERLGVKVHHRSTAELASAVVEAIRAEGAASAMLAHDLGADSDAIRAALVAAGIEIVEGDEPEQIERAAAGVSRAAFGIAETGSLGVLGNDLQARAATMLPLVYVALLDRAVVYRSLDEAAAHVERAMGQEGVRYASLVTGPSRTADVEKTLAVGVHGPRVVHIVLVNTVSSSPAASAVATPQERTETVAQRSGE